MRYRSHAPRRGLTLLEVIVSLAIFLFSLAALAHLINLASERALEGRQRQEAAFRAQSLLAELSIGSIPLTSQADAPLDEESGWLWSVDCQPGDVDGMWRVEVRVRRARTDGTFLQVALQQVMLDPKIKGSSLDQPPGGEPPADSEQQGEQKKTDSSSSSSSSKSSSTPPKSGGTSGGGMSGMSGGSIPIPPGITAPSGGVGGQGGGMSGTQGGGKK